MIAPGSLSSRPDHEPKPRDSLRAAEDAARTIRKLLRSSKCVFARSGLSRSLDDAVGRADLIEHLARYGQGCSAAEASDLAYRLEPLVRELADEVLELLASTISV